MKTFITASVSALVLAALVGCSSAPAQQPVTAAPTPSQSPSATTTPKAVPKPTQAPVAAVQADPKIMTQINSQTDCMAIKVQWDMWVKLVQNKDLTPAKKAEAQHYAIKTSDRSREIGCVY